MGILGICNRTENWKTARTFAPFIENQSFRKCLAEKLLTPLGKKLDTRSVELELFWKGMRDYVHYAKLEGHEEADLMQSVASVYSKSFGTLRRCVEHFRDSQNPKEFKLSWKDHHYTHEDTKRLYDNVFNTEIDIVLETPKYLFIGEAKDESDFGTDAKLVLVHQLIRQYVMASLLVQLKKEPKKEIVPFVVARGCKLDSVKNTVQVKFMDRRGWLNKHNVLSWDCIKRIANAA